MPFLAVEAREVAGITSFFHMYIVFENNGNEVVLDAVPFLQPNLGNIIIDNFSDPIDRDGDILVERGHTPIASGKKAEDIWNIMLQHAQSINNVVDYEALNPGAQNSNSFVASLFNAVGLDVASFIPGNIPSLEKLPGFDNKLNLTGFVNTHLDATVNGNANDTLVGGAGYDTLIGGAGSDSISGSFGGDSIRGDDGNDFLEGGAGNDWLVGGEGDDLLSGGTNSDTISGGADDDTLSGGAGRIVCWAGRMMTCFRVTTAMTFSKAVMGMMYLKEVRGMTG